MKITYVCQDCKDYECRLVSDEDIQERVPSPGGLCPWGVVDVANWFVDHPKCPDCDGSGYVTRHEVQRAENYMPRSVEYDYDDFCPACDGTGYLPNQKASEQ